MQCTGWLYPRRSARTSTSRTARARPARQRGSSP